MKLLGVAVSAAGCIIGSAAVDILQGPEFIDGVLPEIAHVFGVTSAQHTTLDEMNIRPEDVYVLARAPNVEDALSALEGLPLSKQLKPSASSSTFLAAKPYQDAQLRIAEARAAELAASIAPIVAFAPKMKSTKGFSFASIEISPGQYRSIIYIAIQAVVYSLLVPAALFGLKNAKTAKHIKKSLMLIAFFFAYSVAIIVLQNILLIRSLIALPLALALGCTSMFFALRATHSVEHLRRLMEKVPVPHTQGLEKEPLGWIACVKLYCVVLANMSYHMISSILPYRYGIAGIVTSNSMIAGLLYIAYLVAVSMIVFDKLKKSDPKGAQNRVLAFNCAFIATAGISFFCNLLAIFSGFGDFVAFDPSVFFTVMTTFEFNCGTVLMTAALFAMWGLGAHELAQMEASGKNVDNTESVATSNPEDAYRAVADALEDVRTKGFDI